MNRGGVVVHGASKHDSTVYAGSATGSYTGNDTQNRAIPHGLGVTPKLVFLRTTGSGLIFSHVAGSGNMHRNYNTVDDEQAITNADSTNFYVGTAAANYWGNANGTVFDWVAIS